MVVFFFLWIGFIDVNTWVSRSIEKRGKNNFCAKSLIFFFRFILKWYVNPKVQCAKDWSSNNGSGVISLIILLTFCQEIKEFPIGRWFIHLALTLEVEDCFNELSDYGMDFLVVSLCKFIINRGFIVSGPIIYFLWVLISGCCFLLSPSLICGIMLLSILCLLFFIFSFVAIKYI